MRRRRSFLLVLAAALALLVVLAAGCGGDDAEESGASPEEQWASDVCTAVDEWKTSITTIVTDFSGGVSKDALTEKVDEAESATQTLVDSLRDIGPPDTEAGDQAEQEVSDFADSVESTIDDVKSQAEGLKDAGLTGLASGLAEIGSELGGLVDEGKTTLESIQELDTEGDLRTALENDETCQSLVGSN